MRITARPMSAAIPQLWDAFVPRIGEITGIGEAHTTYGLMANNNDAAGTFDYMCGVALLPNHGAAPPAGMSRWAVPEGDYAVFASTLSTLGDTFGFIMGTWLPASRYMRTPQPYFEYYGPDFSPATPNASIYIPVVARG
jgi:AraC family transcriptional regulator